MYFDTNKSQQERRVSEKHVSLREALSESGLFIPINGAEVQPVLISLNVVSSKLHNRQFYKT